MMEGISKKIYLELEEPTEEDNRSYQRRILDGLKSQGISAAMNIQVMRKLYPLCDAAEWKVTVSLGWNGQGWTVTELEAGDTVSAHFGYAVDLGSTTIVARLVNCETGEILAEASEFNGQIAFGMDILSRIFYSKDHPEHLEEIRQATITSIQKVLKKLEEKTGIKPQQVIQMVISGNTTMIHFLIGMDAFCVFSTPYAVRADQPEFLPASELGLPVQGYVYCYPGKSNYLGGDIISGMIDTQVYNSENVCAFFDIGTNGELVIGNREFLLCGAGAAGPALEGGVVKTGMRAEDGAVEGVLLENGCFVLNVIGGTAPRGICGSGIVDMIAQLFLHGWIDLRGKFEPQKSQLIRMRLREEADEHSMEYAVEYAPGLYFFQSDIDEFVRTKAAAYTMVECMMKEAGFTMEDIDRFYVAGAFGKHVSKESAISIGMYPDMERERIVNAGNSSLEGAQKLLLHRQYLRDIHEILEKMIYIQFGAIDDFLHIMVAAQALPHTDLERYPSVMEKLKKFQNIYKID